MSKEPLTASNVTMVMSPSKDQPFKAKDQPTTQHKKSAALGYTPTMMYGKYTQDLGRYAKEEARKFKDFERQRRSMDKPWSKELYAMRSNGFTRVIGNIWRNTLGRLGDEWVLMVLLGLSVAVLSFAMDEMIGFLHKSRVRLFRMAPENVILQYLAWVLLPVLLVMFGSGFVQVVSPQAIGSGFAEIRSILRGVVLKGFLNFSTLIAKVVGLTVTLGAGMPLGKEGPFVHIAAILSQLYGKAMTSIGTFPQNDSHNLDLLAAAAAVGVGACFASPVGGVLLSIEATAPYFAVRNYWRGFLGAVCGTLLYRLLFVWGNTQNTITALYETNFARDISFCPTELFVFCLFGVLCGVLGALFVYIQKVYILWMKSTRIHNYLQKARLFYPAIVSLIIATLQYPYGMGRYTAGELNSHDHFHHLFSNFTWSKSDLNQEELHVTDHWTTPQTNAIAHLAIFFAFSYLFSIIASTMPVPSGMFVPLFKIGATLGRLVGESMHIWFPLGLPYGNGSLATIVPGGYAVVGAAAFAGAVTHTVSICAIVFEITGQIKYMGPVIVASLVANIVARKLHPSMYDMMADIKKLPHLPDVSPSSGSDMYNVYVQDFMIGEVLYIWKGMSYQELADMLETSKNIKSLPLVDSCKERVLLGSVERVQLLTLIDNHMGRARRQEVAAERWQEEQLNKNRRPSVFEVFPDSSEESEPNEEVPKKRPMLKRFHSSPAGVDTRTVNTVQGSEPSTDGRLRNSFRNLFKKNAATVSKPRSDPETGTRASKKVFITEDRKFDLLPEERKLWEEEEMAITIDFYFVQIDPAPVQLVENTSIFKVHRMFSMVGIDTAYVTNLGRLVGVVGLKELRKAIDGINKGTLVAETLRQQHEEEARLVKQNKKLSVMAFPQESRSKKSSMNALKVDIPLGYVDDLYDIDEDNRKHIR